MSCTSAAGVASSSAGAPIHDRKSRRTRLLAQSTQSLAQSTGRKVESNGGVSQLRRPLGAVVSHSP